MRLQLAEGENRLVKEGTHSKPFVYVPGVAENGQGIYLREDHFDGLSNYEFYKAMKALAPFQREVKNGSMSESYYMADKARRRKKREERDERKKEKKESKAAKKTAKTEKKQSKADARRTKAEAKKIKAESGGGAEKRKELFNKAASILGPAAASIIGKRAGGGGAEPGDGEEDKEKKPWYKTTPGMVGIGAGALLLLGGIGVAVSRRKKRK